MYTQTDRLSDRPEPTDRQTVRQVLYTQTDRLSDRPVDTDRLSDRHVHREEDTLSDRHVPTYKLSDRSVYTDRRQACAERQTDRQTSYPTYLVNQLHFSDISRTLRPSNSKQLFVPISYSLVQYWQTYFLCSCAKNLDSTPQYN